ncbi:MAG: DUF1553 domain-containing protein, partial [Pirellulaceae bacterium]|nr:DUF1553 domain-containing protein [Pirellulaceae bacterium]
LRVLTRAETAESRWLRDDSTAEPQARPPRVALANWLTDEQQGAGHLLARVIVNRLWQHHLGRGIVATPSDFGSQGAPPTHPELLDFLAAELVRGDWRRKPIHRLILTSAVYRQSGADNTRGSEVDPDNLLWWRRGATRLEAEVIRDSLLAVSGALDKKMFGPGSLDQANPRRSVYLTVKRSNLIPILQLFDAPDSIQGLGQRDVTTVPPQALAMMNSPFARKFAEQFAKRIRPSAEKTTEQLVNEAYALALSRPPTSAETSRMVGFIDSQAKSYGDDEQAMERAVADYCQIMFCLNEFVFID